MTNDQVALILEELRRIREAMERMAPPRGPALTTLLEQAAARPGGTPRCACPGGMPCTDLACPHRVFVATSQTTGLEYRGG